MSKEGVWCHCYFSALCGAQLIVLDGALRRARRGSR